MESNRVQFFIMQIKKGCLWFFIILWSYGGFDLEKIRRATSRALDLINAHQIQPRRGPRPWSRTFLIAFLFFEGCLPQLSSGNDVVLSVVVHAKQGHAFSFSIQYGHCFSYTMKRAIAAFIGANHDGTCTKRDHNTPIHYKSHMGFNFSFYPQLGVPSKGCLWGHKRLSFGVRFWTLKSVCFGG